MYSQQSVASTTTVPFGHLGCLEYFFMSSWLQACSPLMKYSQFPHSKGPLLPRFSKPVLSSPFKALTLIQSITSPPVRLNGSPCPVQWPASYLSAVHPELAPRSRSFWADRQGEVGLL